MLWLSHEVNTCININYNAENEDYSKSNVLHINHDDKKDMRQNIKNNARKADAYKF